MPETESAVADEVAIDMAVELWSVIDGAMDNAGSDAIDFGDEDAHALASEIREVGGAQVPWAENYEWPPMDQVITIRLAVNLWRFVLEELRKSAPVYEQIMETAHADHRQDYVDSLELGNRAADLIAASIGEPDGSLGR
jgi:hypothetical protein